MEILSILLVVALVAALVAVWFLTLRLGEAKTRIAVAEEKSRTAESLAEEKLRTLESVAAERERAAGQRLAETRAECERRLNDLREADEARMEEMRRSLGENFRALAADTLDATAKRQDERARASLEAVLGPMRQAFEKLSGDFARRAVDDSSQRTALREGIEALRRLNEQVSDETRRLTTALKGNTGFQGRWGEMVLENILESSGLESGRWVVYQESTTTGDGERLRPDAVIHCPRKRDIIIDSKVSLTAYLRMVEAETDEERKALLQDHLKSVEAHLKGLSNKEYQKHIGANDAGFVLMFVPHEGAYLAAMQADVDLWQKAYDRHVVIVSPTHLITVVRLVEQMWLTEDQTANSLAIAEEATKMLDQFNDFLKDLKDVGTAMDKARTNYDSAVKRLSTGRGNVIRRAERLRELGLKTKAPLTQLPEKP